MKKMVFPMLLALSLLLLSRPIFAEESRGDELPSAELLEFLAAFDDPDTGWVDPGELLAMDERALADAGGKEADDDGQDKK